MTKNMKKRCFMIYMAFLYMFMIITLRIINYQYIRSRDLQTLAENQYQYKENINELNYSLLDCKGKDLLTYNYKYYAVIDPSTFLSNNNYTKEDVLEAVKIILKGYNDNYDIDNELQKNKNEKIKWEIDESSYNKLKEIKGVNGFYVYKYSSVNRNNGWWNIENLISNVYKNHDGKLINKSEDSIEMMIANKTKENEPVYHVFNKDVNGNIIGEHETVSKNNINVRLTLDLNLQQNIKSILNSDDFGKFEQIGVILMESDTGKVRAMVQRDDSKPNVNIGASTQNGFFIGSIFKVIVEAAGIETNTISLNHLYDYKDFGGIFEEHEDKLKKNSKEALVKSSNNVFVQIGEDVGIKNVDLYSKKFGLYEKILGFDAEQSGNLELNVKESHDDSGDSYQAYIGQKTRVTPIEAISIPNTIVNGGVYIKPYIIEGFTDKDNRLIEKFTTDKRRVISESTANIMKNQMIEVVNSENGTAKGTNIEGIEIGGKTGTSKRIENHNEVKDYYDGWFAGFFKVNEKYYSMIVFVQNIGKDINASGSAVPIFKKIVQENYDYLMKY